MRIVMLLGDGMGDYPLPELAGMTPLQKAELPTVRRLAAGGQVYAVQTIPEGMSSGSDVANLSIMGFDPRVYYTGRAPIEAVGAGLAPSADDVIFRCNLITDDGERIVDHSAGHITTSEGTQIIAALQAQLGTAAVRFHAGTGYRHLVLWKHGPLAVKAAPPHDILGQPLEKYLPRGDGAADMIKIMDAAREILKDHPVNIARQKSGRSPATRIWLWGQGRRAALPAYADLYGLSGGVISAVDLVRGIGRLAGLAAPPVAGATGFIDTNYAGKVAAAREILASGGNFVFLHVEAPDECGHLGDLGLKLKAIGDFDQKIVAPVYAMLEETQAPYRLIVATDHRTPLAVRGHTREPVPLLVYDGPRPLPVASKPFDEFCGAPAAPLLAFDCMRALLKEAGETAKIK